MKLNCTSNLFIRIYIYLFIFAYITSVFWCSYLLLNIRDIGYSIYCSCSCGHFHSCFHNYVLLWIHCTVYKVTGHYYNNICRLKTYRYIQLRSYCNVLPYICCMHLFDRCWILHYFRKHIRMIYHIRNVFHYIYYIYCSNSFCLLKYAYIKKNNTVDIWYYINNLPPF